MTDQRALISGRVELTENERRMLLLAYRDTVLDPGEAVVIQAESLLAERLGRSGSAERQTWERLVPGSDVAEQRIHLEVDDQGHARVHEALLAQMLVDAGWERTS